MVTMVPCCLSCYHGYTVTMVTLLPCCLCCQLSATISLKRKHLFYTMNMVLPCVMLTSLTLITFLSPPDQGEKMSLGISILISFAVFMLTLVENMPKTSESLPLFGKWLNMILHPTPSPGSIPGGDMGKWLYNLYLACICIIGTMV